MGVLLPKLQDKVRSSVSERNAQIRLAATFLSNVWSCRTCYHHQHDGKRKGPWLLLVRLLWSVRFLRIVITSLNGNTRPGSQLVLESNVGLARAMLLEGLPEMWPCERLHVARPQGQKLLPHCWRACVGRENRWEVLGLC